MKIVSFEFLAPGSVWSRRTLAALDIQCNDGALILTVDRELYPRGIWTFQPVQNVQIKPATVRQPRKVQP